ncbi:MAG TPA: alternative ribosome rescue aminoacyl-tRNA hydrolase ArfB [Gemmatimonadaceae bacterium]|nr:alternative ribosome rescue aminoacyl-tRNA hydrolase ArfB [Gemmatimonadaceae bacterium]
MARDAHEDEGPRDVLIVGASVRIPRTELDVRATRSGGPGGQHVNTSSTKIELRWQPVTSVALSDVQRERLLTNLASKLDGEGWLRLTASEHRSQLQNREAAEARLVAMVKGALVVPKVRRATKPTFTSKVKRLEGKSQRSEVKQQRRRVSRDE